MSLNRYAAKVDANQPDIVKGLRKAGVKVWIIRRPVDLAYKWAGLFGLLEVKTEDWNGKYSSEEQREACEDFGVPVVKTLNEALYAVGVI